MMCSEIVAVVEFDKHDRIYKAGGTLRGILHVDCPSTVEIFALSISFNGETSVTYYGAIEKHSDHETHLGAIQDIIEIYKNEKREDAKVTKVPFQFDLPADLPSSIESSFGFTRYCII